VSCASVWGYAYSGWPIPWSAPLSDTVYGCLPGDSLHLEACPPPKTMSQSFAPSGWTVRGKLTRVAAGWPWKVGHVMSASNILNSRPLVCCLKPTSHDQPIVLHLVLLDFTFTKTPGYSYGLVGIARLFVRTRMVIVTGCSYRGCHYSMSKPNPNPNRV